jgi:hypothetical protein
MSGGIGESSGAVHESPKPKRRKRTMSQADKQPRIPAHGQNPTEKNEESLEKDVWGIPLGRSDGTGPHFLASRFFENQAQALGPFPFGNGTGKVDDLDGLMSTMLESSIEPIDTGKGQKRMLSGFDSSLPSISALNYTSEGIQQSYADMINNSVKKSPPINAIHASRPLMEAGPPIRNQETAAEFQLRMNNTLVAHPGNMYLSQQQKQGVVGPWDLEPTPLLGSNGGTRDANISSEQRASALAHLIWSEERNNSS